MLDKLQEEERNLGLQIKSDTTEPMRFNAEVGEVIFKNNKIKSKGFYILG